MRPSLRDQAQQQAQQLEPVTIGQLRRILKALPDKASGPDALSTTAETSTSAIAGTTT